MKRCFLVLLVTGLAIAASGQQSTFAGRSQLPQEAEEATADTGAEHLRIETEFGPLHVWRPAGYEPSVAGIVVYIHGYYISVDESWIDDDLEAQFRASGRNALFIAIQAPEGRSQEVAWKSLEDLLRTVGDRIPFPMPRGPLVVVGHSGAYRTILMWLADPHLQEVILLDGLYGGQTEFRRWLGPHAHVTPHHLVLVSSVTWRQSSQFARRTYGAVRLGNIPTESSTFTRHELRAPLLYLRSQYDHQEIVSSGKVIPVLLQITRIGGLAAVTAEATEAIQNSAPASTPIPMPSQ
jgi:hypothetical protein